MNFSAKDSVFEDSASDNYECFERIDLAEPSGGLGNEFELAADNINHLAKDMHLYIKHYKTYGKKFLKQHKLSPDSFIQIALQYAFYKYYLQY